MRGAYAPDLALLVKSWVQEARHSPFSIGCPDDIFFPEHRRVVLALLRRAWTTVAVNVDDPDHIYGFVTFELAPARLHWVYVKSPYRRIGLGRSLLESAFGPELGKGRVLASHLSNTARLLTAQAERLRLVYCPYLLLRDTADAPAPESEPERPETFDDGPDSPGP